MSLNIESNFMLLNAKHGFLDTGTLPPGPETFTIKYFYSVKSISVYYRNDTEYFGWDFSVRRLFEIIDLLLNSKHDIYLRAGHLIECSIIHE